MDFRLTEEQELLRRTVREFAETEMRPHVRSGTKRSIFRPSSCRSSPRSACSASSSPKQYGGAGMSAIDYCICIEELARVDPAWRCRWPRTTASARRTSSLFGSEEQKQTYLAPLARGEKIGAWGLTESTSGSDAAGMRTTAVRAGDGWVLNGSKTFTTHGRVGDIVWSSWRSPIAPPARRASPRSSSRRARPA